MASINYLLQEVGVPRSKVTWVQPMAPSLPSSVGDMVQEAVEEGGGVILRGYRLHRYNKDERGDLESIVLSHYVNDLQRFAIVDCKVERGCL